MSRLILSGSIALLSIFCFILFFFIKSFSPERRIYVPLILIALLLGGGVYFKLQILPSYTDEYEFVVNFFMSQFNSLK
jgi:hypothetical protein